MSGRSCWLKTVGACDVPLENRWIDSGLICSTGRFFEAPGGHLKERPPRVLRDRLPGDPRDRESNHRRCRRSDGGQGRGRPVAVAHPRADAPRHPDASARTELEGLGPSERHRQQKPYVQLTDEQNRSAYEAITERPGPGDCRLIGHARDRSGQAGSSSGGRISLATRRMRAPRRRGEEDRQLAHDRRTHRRSVSPRAPATRPPARGSTRWCPRARRGNRWRRPGRRRARRSPARRGPSRSGVR